MPANVLVASPDGIFGELLRISLEENGGYAVKLAASPHELLAAAASRQLDLVIVDAGIAGDSAAELINLLMAQHPDLKVVVIPLDNNPLHPSMAGSRPHAYLYRPFFQPDLFQTLELVLRAAPAASALSGLPAGESREVTRTVPGAHPGSAEPGLHGINDQPAREPPNQLIELENLVQEPDIYGALISGQGQVVACKGRLPKAEAESLAKNISSTRDATTRGDIIYFGQLGNLQNVLYYSTGLTDRLTLTVIFDSEQRISSARRRTGQAASILRRQLENQKKMLSVDTAELSGSPGNGWTRWTPPAV